MHVAHILIEFLNTQQQTAQLTARESVSVATCSSPALFAFPAPSRCVLCCDRLQLCLMSVHSSELSLNAALQLIEQWLDNRLRFHHRLRSNHASSRMSVTGRHHGATGCSCDGSQRQVLCSDRRGGGASARCAVQLDVAIESGCDDNSTVRLQLNERLMGCSSSSRIQRPLVSSAVGSLISLSAAAQ